MLLTSAKPITMTAAGSRKVGYAKPRKTIATQDPTIAACRGMQSAISRPMSALNVLPNDIGIVKPRDCTLFCRAGVEQDAVRSET